MEGEQAKQAYGSHRAVVCDDDALVRNVVGQVLAESRFEVVGEAETPAIALDLVARTHPDVVVIDLALRAGSGENLLEELRERHPDVRAVVFSAYAADPDSLEDHGATAVIDKPDFEGLGRAVAAIAHQLGSPVERRREEPRAITPLPAPTAISLSGFEPWDSFITAAEALVPGDAILAVDIVPHSSLVLDWDDVFRADYRLALGRALANSRRVQDRISVGPGGLPTVLIVAGYPEAPTSVFQRLEVIWEREVASGTPIGAFGAVREGDDPLGRLEAVQRAVEPGGTTLRML